jgi:phenylpropionate dioxygenase-like ring-hydroxylating dioxygenase large terminal subunit
MQIEGFDIPSEQLNQATQPTVSMPVFNNRGVVAEGWYFVCSSGDLKPLKAKGFQVCGQELVLFRGADNAVRALDAYCPHMGTHLGAGKVVGNEIRCFFHHWKFDESGKCTDIPCQKNIPEKARVHAYKVTEKYGAVWVHPNPLIDKDLSDFPDLKNSEVKVVMGKPYLRKVHHHVTMINGIDPQHLKTVHNLNIEMDLEISEENDGRQIDITLSGNIPDSSLPGKITRALMGSRYGYSMRYDHANNGLLTLMKDVHLFGRGPKLPTLHMIFAYRPISATQTLVQPIYVTKKRSGVFGFLGMQTLIFMTKRAFFALQGEDGVVYENMRFFPKTLLAIDKPVAQYIQYVNKLPVCLWKVPHGFRN